MKLARWIVPMLAFSLVACNDLDVPNKLQRGAELADALPNATYRTLAGRAHLPYLEAPDEVAALVALTATAAG